MAQQKQAILLIETDQATVDLYRRELSREYDVFICSDERQALDLLGTQPVGAVVVEPALDGGRGWAILSTITSTSAARHIPIVVCSTLDERRRAMELGATIYLTKPTLPATLRDCLQRVLRQS